MPIYDWDNDQDRILRQIGTKSVLKICCKVLDEPLLTESWIQHHAGIVGFDNLILADNMSSDPTMTRILEEYSSRMTIFRFSGSHNEIHWHPRFRPLFQAIRENSRFFSFIDIDERLVRVENGRYQADARLLDALETMDTGDIIAASWLINALNSTQRFCVSIDDKKNHRIEHLRWGKPILPSSLAGAQPGIHSAQYDDFRFSTDAGTAFFLLHLTQFPERRIATNRNKLISRGIVDKALSAGEIMEFDFSDHKDKSFMPLVDEMREMRRLLDADDATVSKAYPGHHHVTFGADGDLVFDDETARAEFSSFLSRGSQLVEETFNRNLPERDALAQKLYEKSIKTRDAGNETQAEALLSFGMRAFPDCAHEFGGPAFQKELMRMYLSKADWSRATGLVPDRDVGFGTHWHSVLFARAYAKAGHVETATSWWNEVLRQDPNNGEARKAVLESMRNDTLAPSSEMEAVIQDLQDVSELMSQSRVQAHWFMMKYFEHVGRTVDNGYAQLNAMTEAAVRTAQTWKRPADGTVPTAIIPRLLHKIWLTNAAAPAEPPEDYIDALLDDAARLTKAGWQVLLWIQDERFLPATITRIRDAGSAIQIRVIGDHIQRGRWGELYDAFLNDRKFPFAADILRMVILNEYGGFYGDMGVRIKDVAIANFVAENFDYSFIFWDTMFFQNSFMAMSPASQLAQMFMKFAEDPYLVPRSLISPVTGLSEGQAFSGLMVTAILLSIWRPGVRVFPFAANRRLMSWSSQQSWYKKGGKHGNTYVPDSGPSFISDQILAERFDSSRQPFKV